MEQTKQNLTLLITKINESLPDDNDLKGFAGISKALITDTLVQSDALLIPLKDFDNNFEVIVLKRELAELFDKINKELADKFEKIKPEKFQSFLKQVTQIKFLIKETYISVASSAAIRTETEIAKAKEELTLLTSNNEALKKINTDLVALKDTTTQNINTINTDLGALKDTTTKNITTINTDLAALKESTTQTITTINTDATTLKNATAAIHEEAKVLKDAAATIVTDFQAKQKTSTDNEKLITDFLATIEGHKTAVEAIQKNTTTWEQDIKAAKEALATKVPEFDALNDKSKILQAEIEATHEKIFGKKDADGKPINGYLQETEDLKIKMATFLTEQQTKYSAQFKEIEGLLPGSTSVGLAKAYQIQKDSYKIPILLWSGIFIVTIGAMTALSIFLLYKQFQSTQQWTLNDAFISLLKDLPFFIPTIWMASYASKQQSQYKRLQQEYAFKETNAKSFHGHKKQIEDLMKDSSTDKVLLEQLVAQLVIITAYNPSQTLDNNTHEDSPPIFKLVEKYFPSFKKNKEK